MAHQLPPLPYPANALEPFIDEQTMMIYYARHHNTYVVNLNKALSKYPELQNKSMDALLQELELVPDDIRTAVRNNGGGHANHSLFWEVIGPKGGGQPGGVLAAAIDRELGGFEKFKEEFAKAAMNRFGSGWAYSFIGLGHLGACVLSQVSKQAARLYFGLLEYCQLERSRKALRFCYALAQL